MGFAAYECPTDPRQRILEIPRFGPDREPMFALDDIEPETRKRLKAEQTQRFYHACANRKLIEDRVKKDPTFIRKLIAMCKKDIVFFFDTFLWTWDDRRNADDEKRLVQFILYPKQRELARRYSDQFHAPGNKRRTLFIEKSRAVGFSWIIAGCILHSFLFRDGHTTLIGAVKLKDVDNGGQGATINCHMGRIRFMLRHLPEWMIPVGIDSEEFNKTLLLSNPEKEQNVITGCQMDSNMGRMGRFTEVWLDEIAHTDDFDEAIASIGSTTRRVLMGTSPKGRDTASARMRFSNPALDVMLIHWTSNPNLDADWYWGERKEFGADVCASELDVSYDLSATNRVFKEFDPAVNVEKFDYDPNLPLHVAMDPGIDDIFAILWIQPSRLERTYRIVDHVTYNGKSGEWFIPLLLGRFPTHTKMGEPWPMDRYDAQAISIVERHGRWNPVDEAYGDQHGDARDKVYGGSLYDFFYSWGFVQKFGGVVGVKHGDKVDAVRRAEIVIPRVRIADSIANQKTQSVLMPSLLECFQQYEWVDSTSPTGRPMKHQPKHNDYSHSMDAWQFYLAGKEEDVADSLCEMVPDARQDFHGIADSTGNTGSYVPEYESSEINGGV